jgi:peptide methionine sulfoxide reductase MsrB
MKVTDLIWIFMLSVQPDGLKQMQRETEEKGKLSERYVMKELTRRKESDVDKGMSVPSKANILIMRRHYCCKRCGAPVPDEDKFDAGCGWPSLTMRFKGAV